jgi:hypothetical protein
LLIRFFVVVFRGDLVVFLLVLFCLFFVCCSVGLFVLFLFVAFGGVYALLAVLVAVSVFFS